MLVWFTHNLKLDPSEIVLPIVTKIKTIRYIRINEQFMYKLNIKIKKWGPIDHHKHRLQSSRSFGPANNFVNISAMLVFVPSFAIRTTLAA